MKEAVSARTKRIKKQRERLVQTPAARPVGSCLHMEDMSEKHSPDDHEQRDDLCFE